ncbi:TPA: site-specific integrase [Enterobacter asburiae]|nr:site-specific integrase [Enterobacter asburiae]HDN2549016.1 site-specific integrase [Enterobacter asburiae]
MAAYPTGVEVHGESLRIWFIYQGKRVRENLGVPDTPKNRKMAGELRASVCFAIKTGTFNYASQFPDSSNAEKFSTVRKQISLLELKSKWLGLKEMELSLGTLRRYDCHLTTTIETIGEHRYIGSLNTEDILSARKELLNGWQKTRYGLNHPPKKGRSVPTVNSYMACLGGMLSFAFKIGYLKTDLMAGITPLAKERPIPDPLTSDEYQRVVAACPTLQFQNMVIFAVNTGVRHGELSALSWEDVDTVNWTVTVSRNYSLKGNFTLPKTNAGIRTIQLTQPAIDALKAQMPLTRMMASHKVSVSLREYKKKRTDECTFIFSPSITSMNGKKTMCYVPGSINSAWRTALRRAGVRQRRSYETRNTYACWALVAGANPNFVAHQMGHSSAQMLFTVYGKWMTENNHDQVGILNASFTQNAPLMPHRKTA